MSDIRFERDGPIGRLALARPDKRNAQTLGMWDELRRLGAELLQGTDLRVLAVTGDGPVFSAGIDLSLLRRQAAGSETSELPPVEQVQQSFIWLRSLPCPTVAIVQGAALGAGFQLALACDLRVMADDAVLGLPEIDFGIFPDLGGCAWLPELIGSARAKELIFTGERFGALEAHRLGLANRVVPAAELAQAGEQLVQALAAKPPLALAAAKRAIHAAAESAEAALLVSAREVKRCLASEDFAEAVRAASERRAPVFRGR